MRCTGNITFPFLYFMKGEPAHVDLTMSGAKQIKSGSVRAHIVDMYGKQIISGIKPTPHDEAGVRYSFTFNPPKEKFKIMVKGQTTQNKTFQRVSPRANQMKPLVLKEFYNSGRYSIKQRGSTYIMLYLFNGMNSDQVFKVSF